MRNDTVIEKQARIVHRPDDKDYLDPVRQHVRLWANWRKSDLPTGLGYPSRSAEQPDMNGGARALPEWVIELTIDHLIMSVMKPELRRALLAVNGVPVRYQEGKDAGAILPKMKFIVETNKYHWPTEMAAAAAAAGMKKRTLYSQYNQALYWLDGRLT